MIKESFWSHGSHQLGECACNCTVKMMQQVKRVILFRDLFTVILVSRSSFRINYYFTYFSTVVPSILNGRPISPPSICTTLVSSEIWYKIGTTRYKILSKMADNNSSQRRKYKYKSEVQKVNVKYIINMPANGGLQDKVFIN